MPRASRPARICPDNASERCGEPAPDRCPRRSSAVLPTAISRTTRGSHRFANVASAVVSRHDAAHERRERPRGDERDGARADRREPEDRVVADQAGDAVDGGQADQRDERMERSGRREPWPTACVPRHRAEQGQQSAAGGHEPGVRGDRRAGLRSADGSRAGQPGSARRPTGWLIPRASGSPRGAPAKKRAMSVRLPGSPVSCSFSGSAQRASPNTMALARPRRHERRAIAAGARCAMPASRDRRDEGERHRWNQPDVRLGQQRADPDDGDHRHRAASRCRRAQPDEQRGR